MRIVVSIYNPPEYFPPTMNAVALLSQRFESITIVTRNIECKHAAYPANVNVIRVGKRMDMNEAVLQGQVKKLGLFVQYVKAVHRIVKREKPAVWLAFDSIGLYAFHLVSKFTGRPRTAWYHNHDVKEPGAPARKYSITWWAEKHEPKAFDKLDIFSLPAAERMKYFPLNGWRGKHFVVPNYPLKAFYKDDVKAHPPAGELRLIYQGSISPDHGFEELIPLLNTTINGKSLKLTLIGNVSQEYKNELTELAQSSGTSQQLDIRKPVAYEDLVAITASNHIGLAIHKPSTIIYSTGGTASNKIYEYAALGLPVLLYDNEHYRQHLHDKKWTFFTDCSKESLLSVLAGIDNRYLSSSEAARGDFMQSLNYENSFSKVMNEVLQRSVSHH